MKAMRFALVVTLAFLLLGPFGHSTTAQNGKTQSDKDPSVVDWEDMRYPLAARLRHAEGVVVVRVKLNNGGKVTGAEALSGPKDLVPDCLTNAKTWRFAANSRDNAIIVYWFHIEGECHGSGPSLFALFAPNLAKITSCEGHIEP
jgi:TonB family protein